MGSPTLSAPMKVKSKKFNIKARNLETPPSPLLRRALSPDHEKKSMDLFGSAPRSRSDSGHGLDCVPIADIDEDIDLEREATITTTSPPPTAVKASCIKEALVKAAVHKILKEPKAKPSKLKLKRCGNVTESS